MSLNLNEKIVILIPALNPNIEFIEYVDELISKGFKNIVVINDGSKQECNQIFEQINSKQECHIIKHDVNKGKGKSLKDGLKYFESLGNYKDYIGAITVDCDGQHLVKDVIKIAEAMSKQNKSLILGVRNFEDKNIPEKSSFGNKITSKVFKILYGTKITDTQTGLRGIPTSLVKDFINIAGNRYEYETNMLINCIINKHEIVEVPIETVYIDNNSGTHFKPIRDSISIYCRILNSFIKYSAVSIISFVVDIVIFKLLLVFLNLDIKETDLIILATVGARIVSSLVNYTLNKKVTFKNNQNVLKTLIKYYTLCVIQMLTSAFIVATLFKLTGISEVFIKLIVDMILFLINYKIQKTWVFKN